MKNIKFATLGLVTIAFALGGCTLGREYIELENNQKDITLTLGESSNSYLYNVKEPINVTFKAPDNSMIVIDGKYFPSHKITLQPQEEVVQYFTIEKDNKKQKIEANVYTFKQVMNPTNRNTITTKVGKNTSTVGYKNKLDVSGSELTLEMHEYNEKRKNYFYLTGGDKELTIRMIAPKYASFIFEDGSKKKEHVVKVKEDSSVALSIGVIRDNATQKSRDYKFIREQY